MDEISQLFPFTGVAEDGRGEGVDPLKVRLVEAEKRFLLIKFKLNWLTSYLMILASFPSVILVMEAESGIGMNST